MSLKWKRWKDPEIFDDYYTECPYCHYCYADNAYFEMDQFPFCPHCGKKVKVVKDELRLVYVYKGKPRRGKEEKVEAL